MECNFNKLSVLDISQNLDLEILRVSSNLLTDIDMQNNIKLNEIILSSNKFKSLDFSNLTNLDILDVHSTEIDILDVTKNTNLFFLTCVNTKIKELDLTNNSKLKFLNIGAMSELTSIDISKNPNLFNLVCDETPLNDLDLTNNFELNILSCRNVGLSSLDLKMNTKLTQLYCEGNKLTTLDISNNKGVKFLKCGQSTLNYLIMKNGFNHFKNVSSCENNFIFNIENSPNLKYICVDEGELDCIQYRVDEEGYANCTVGTYCSFNPGGDYYEASGKSYFDKDNTGCNANTPFFPVAIKYNVKGGTMDDTYIGKNSGSYNIPIEADGSYVITPTFENPDYFNSVPANFTANFPSDGNVSSQNFCISPNGTKPDLEIAVIPLDAARPGFNARYKILYKNKGNILQSGKITLAFQDEFMDLVSAFPMVGSQSPSLLAWNYSNLYPLEVKTIELNFKLNTPMATPPLNGDDVIKFTGTIDPVVGDITPEDNVNTLAQTVVNSFDPNDKTCLEGNVIRESDIGNYVHYLIRFENKGTAKAINIVVKDIIDTQKLDINTLVPLDSSHSFSTKITNGNEVEFIFENINLPFKLGSNNGHLMFKIKTLATLNVGDVFENKAAIYFDYNFPIITNLARTVVNNTLNTNALLSDNNSFKIFPNPNSGLFTVKIKDVIKSITIYDLSGKVLQKEHMIGSRKEAQISTQKLSKGVYLINIESNKNSYIKKFIKK